MATKNKARTSAITIDELLGHSVRRRRAFEHSSDVLEAAALIRELRKHAGFSQKELADQIGTHQSHISELERGNGPQGPTFSMLKRIARACGDPLVIVREQDWLLLREKTKARLKIEAPREKVDLSQEHLLQEQRTEYGAELVNPMRLFIQVRKKDLATHIGQFYASFISKPFPLRTEAKIDQGIPVAPTDRENPSKVPGGFAYWKNVESFIHAACAPKLTNEPRPAPEPVARIPQVNQVERPLLH